MYRAYVKEPGRRPGDVWSTWFGGFVCVVLGTWFTPFIILLIFVDSDASLNDQRLIVFLLWAGLHLTAAGIGLAFAHELLHHSGHTGEEDEAAEPVTA